MHSHLAKMIGTYILETRTKKKILQKDFSSKVGVSAQFIGRIERGEVMIPEPLLFKVITFLGLSEKKLTQIFRLAGEQQVQELLFRAKNLEEQIA